MGAGKRGGCGRPRGRVCSRHAAEWQPIPRRARSASWGAADGHRSQARWSRQTAAARVTNVCAVTDGDVVDCVGRGVLCPCLIYSFVVCSIVRAAVPGTVVKRVKVE